MCMLKGDEPWISWQLSFHSQEKELTGLTTPNKPEYLLARSRSQLNWQTSGWPVGIRFYSIWVPFNLLMDSFTRNSNLFPAAFQVCLWIGTTHAQASIGISTAIDMMFGLTGRLDDGFALLRRNGSEDRGNVLCSLFTRCYGILLELHEGNIWRTNTKVPCRGSLSAKTLMSFRLFEPKPHFLVPRIRTEAWLGQECIVFFFNHSELSFKLQASLQNIL